MANFFFLKKQKKESENINTQENSEKPFIWFFQYQGRARGQAPRLFFFGKKYEIIGQDSPKTVSGSLGKLKFRIQVDQNYIQLKSN